MGHRDNLGQPRLADTVVPREVEVEGFVPLAHAKAERRLHPVGWGRGSSPAARDFQHHAFYAGRS